MNISFNHVPIIYDIEPKYFWIPFAAAAIAEVVKISLPILFPQQEDLLPLSTLRVGVRKTSENLLEKFFEWEPRGREPFTEDFPENLSINIFVVSIIQLKESTTFGNIRQDPVHVTYILACLMIFNSSIIIMTRIISGMVLSSAASKCPHPFTAQVLKESARFITINRMKDQI